MMKDTIWALNAVIRLVLSASQQAKCDSGRVLKRMMRKKMDICVMLNFRTSLMYVTDTVERNW